MSRCTKKNCPMNAETLNPDCDLKSCPYRTEEISGDLISREQAIKELRTAYFDKNLQSAKDDPCIVDAMTDWAIRTIKRLPSVTPKAEWIPCSERLPEEKDYRACRENLDGAVLWCTERGMIGLGWYYESTKAWADIYDEEIEKRWGKIIEWMPLPEAYKAESEELEYGSN